MATADDGAADITQDRFLSQRTIRAVALGTELPSRDFAAAAFIREFQPVFIPSLLQTRDYASEVVRMCTTTEEGEVLQLVQARMSRQEILDRENRARLWALVDEGALHRFVGGPKVMRAQLTHLIEMCDHPAVVLQVLPFSAGPHRAMGAPFTILRYAQPDMRDVVYIEQLTSALYLDKQTEVEAYLQVLEEACLQAAVPARTPGILKGVLAGL